MNQEVKEKWLEALRSGEYAQGRGVLCEAEGGVPVAYCCLGVLVDLWVKEDPKRRNWGSRWRADCVEFRTLPPRIADWAGLPERNPYVIHANGTAERLSLLNDEGVYDSDADECTPLDFLAIADAIEENF